MVGTPHAFCKPALTKKNRASTSPPTMGIDFATCKTKDQYVCNVGRTLCVYVDDMKNANILSRDESLHGEPRKSIFISAKATLPPSESHRRWLHGGIP